VDVRWARGTAVVGLPSLLSSDEIAALHRVADRVRCEAASE
jgi:hypothetical protein